MDNFEQTIQKAKDVIGVACQKTGEVVATQKLKLDLIGLEGNLNRAYAKLGKMQFELIKDIETDNLAVKSTINEISGLLEQINALNDEIAKNSGKKECPVCGKKLSDDAAFCSACGKEV